ncbi:exocyst complex component 3 isoform X2 [Hydra vulgaris]|uniref:Exocyst complex component 3 isoform X2 n=1 Tax=Hydra vulgaris TaxID=6087 RepID=A0ABM4C9J5_HYDVU
MTEEVELAKCAALQKASKYVASVLVTPDQLDKVEQIRRKIMRNKAAVDSRLKTAVQSQIDGIRSGLNELKSAQEDIAYVKKSLEEVSNIFVECEPLNDKLLKVKVAHERHAKLAKTNSHLGLIFNVPETIKLTENLIKEGKLLQAHKNIMELEATRDDLLLEVYKIYKEEGSKESYTDSPLYAYFSEVDNLSVGMKKQISMIISRTLAAARHTPTELVTSLRIVEREERSDARCINQEKLTGFMPPGRPKCWKDHCQAVIKKSVENRFDSNQLELTDKTDKMWLVRHLERMRALILDDLISVKHLVRPCFPPNYQIFKLYIYYYHDAMSRMLEGFALNQNPSRPNECVTLLQWIAEYYGPELLGHEELKDFVNELKLNTTKENEEYRLEDLLSKGVIDSLTELYVKTTAANIKSCLEKMCLSESQDWNQDKLPETSGDGSFQTSLPIILFQMLDQNLQVGAFIKRNVKLKILDVCASSLKDFAGIYKKAIIDFKNKYFENRASVKYFEPYMVSICNNCIIIAEFSEQMKNQQRAELGEETFSETRLAAFNSAINAYKTLSFEICDILLDSVFVDVAVYYQDLFTRKWLGSPVVIATVIATLEDYSNDYVHLKHLAFQYIMKQAEDRIILEYVRAVLSRRITFRNLDERKDAASQIKEEAKKISETISRISKVEISQDSPCSILNLIAEVLRLKSTDIVSLEISGLATKYPDFRADHALALLAVRGDMGRTECLQLISDLKIKENESSTSKDGIFGRVIPAGSVLESLGSKFK